MTSPFMSCNNDSFGIMTFTTMLSIDQIISWIETEPQISYLIIRDFTS